jgi:hypothetical protein
VTHSRSGFKAHYKSAENLQKIVKKMPRKWHCHKRMASPRQPNKKIALHVHVKIRKDGGYTNNYTNVCAPEAPSQLNYKKNTRKDKGCYTEVEDYKNMRKMCATFLTRPCVLTQWTVRAIA